MKKLLVFFVLVFFVLAIALAADAPGHTVGGNYCSLPYGSHCICDSGEATGGFCE